MNYKFLVIFCFMFLILNSSVCLSVENLPIPDHYGVYLLTTDNTLIELNPVQNYLCHAKTSIDMSEILSGRGREKFFYYLYDDVKTLPLIESDKIKGLYIYGKNFTFNKTGTLAFAEYQLKRTIGIVSGVYKNFDYECKKNISHDSSNHLVYHEYGYDDSRFDQKKIKEDLILFTPKGMALKGGSATEIRGKEEVGGLGVVIRLKESKGYPYFTTDGFNSLLWYMHKNRAYRADYQNFLTQLEKIAYKNKTVNQLVTIAWVYRDQGNKKKAIEIYEKIIIPESKNRGDKEVLDKYLAYFEEIKKDDAAQEELLKSLMKDLMRPLIWLFKHISCLISSGEMNQ